MLVRQGRPWWKQLAETRACMLSTKVNQETGLSGICFLLPQVSDAENVLGIVQIENIQILAEPYDVALSITISKGQWMPPKQSSLGALYCLGRWMTKALGMG